mmetsp:Transcript_19057/g.28751  ORF Transcript_19057/g.28751 Transcript_19057/m.28751 type:complete len:100 (+) Transcript_19057:349-648(+)
MRLGAINMIFLSTKYVRLTKPQIVSKDRIYCKFVLHESITADLARQFIRLPQTSILGCETALPHIHKAANPCDSFVSIRRRPEHQLREAVKRIVDLNRS